MNNMNIETVRTELEVLGNVGTLEERNGMLFISISGVVESQATVTTFNSIVDTHVVTTYPLLEVFTLESGSIKAIYKN